jgi:DNA-binding MarR family transcriptional regulator
MTVASSAAPELEAPIPIGMLLAALGRGASRLFTEALRPTGLKPRHLAALTELRNGPLTQQALGESSHTDPTKLVGLLNDLEHCELVVRRRDVNDRRRHIVEISALGRARLAEVDALIAGAEEQLLAGLEAGDRRRFVELLLHVVRNGGIVATCATAADVAEDGDDEGCPGLS